MHPPAMLSAGFASRKQTLRSFSDLEGSQYSCEADLQSLHPPHREYQAETALQRYPVGQGWPGLSTLASLRHLWTWPPRSRGDFGQGILGSGAGSAGCPLPALPALGQQGLQGSRSG